MKHPRKMMTRNLTTDSRNTVLVATLIAISICSCENDSSTNSTQQTDNQAPTSDFPLGEGNLHACSYTASDEYLTGRGLLECPEKKYSTVTIGGRIWMAENMSWLPEVYPQIDKQAFTQRYYVYGYNGASLQAAKTYFNGVNASYQTYGVLYNYPGAISACPEGWRLPDTADWNQLKAYVSMYDSVGDGLSILLRSSQGWMSLEPGKDLFGFAALPGGGILSSVVDSIGKAGYWWTATPGKNSGDAICQSIDSRIRYVEEFDYSRSYAFSVRCVKQ